MTKVREQDEAFDPVFENLGFMKSSWDYMTNAERWDHVRKHAYGIEYVHAGDPTKEYDEEDTTIYHLAACRCIIMSEWCSSSEEAIEQAGVVFEKLKYWATHRPTEQHNISLSGDDEEEVEDELTCAFQYATSQGVAVDTRLITREEGDQLVERYTEPFKADLQDGNEPEMALWINMVDAQTFAETSIHWSAGDFVIKDGNLYQRV